jgi:phosphate transport system permease protein
MMSSEAPSGRIPTALQVRRSATVSNRLAQVLFIISGFSVFMVLGFILWVLFSNTFEFFREVSIVEFLTTTEWRLSQFLEINHYGVLPLVTATITIAVGALLVGMPIGLATAVYLAEYAPERVRNIMKPVLEILAGIPSIVLGFFALRVISPITQDLFGTGTFSAINAIIVVGFMVIPIITTLSEDAMRAVPAHLKEASFGLGATKWETTRKVVFPAALSGITASVVLAAARAIGETMAVTMAAGSGSNFSINPLDAMQTMTAFIAQYASGDVPQEGPLKTALFAVGATLFVMTLLLNMVARRFIKKYREVEVAN